MIMIWIRIRIWNRIHFFQCGSRIRNRIRIHIKIKWILSTAKVSTVNTKIQQSGLGGNGYRIQEFSAPVLYLLFNCFLLWFRCTLCSRNFSLRDSCIRHIRFISFSDQSLKLKDEKLRLKC